MPEIAIVAIALIVGVALGYGVREWLSRRRRAKRRDNGGRRLLEHNSLGHDALRRARVLTNVVNQAREDFQCFAHL